MREVHEVFVRVLLGRGVQQVGLLSFPRLALILSGLELEEGRRSLLLLCETDVFVLELRIHEEIVDDDLRVLEGLAELEMVQSRLRRTRGMLLEVLAVGLFVAFGLTLWGSLLLGEIPALGGLLGVRSLLEGRSFPPEVPLLKEVSFHFRKRVLAQKLGKIFFLGLLLDQLLFLPLLGVPNDAL